MDKVVMPLTLIREFCVRLIVVVPKTKSMETISLAISSGNSTTPKLLKEVVKILSPKSLPSNLVTGCFNGRGISFIFENMLPVAAIMSNIFSFWILSLSCSWVFKANSGKLSMFLISSLKEVNKEKFLKVLDGKRLRILTGMVTETSPSISSMLALEAKKRMVEI